MRATALLRTARHRAGLTQRELASRTGIPQSTIARIENGQTDPRMSTLNTLLVGCGQMLVGSGLSVGVTSGRSERAARYLPEITRRLAERFNPARIVLFGSQATGRAGADSDVDLLIIVDRVEDKRRLRVAMRQALVDLPIDKDLLVATTEEAMTRGAAGGSLMATALREGVPIYER